MAITEERPLELTTGSAAVVREPMGVFRRPTATTGWRSWLTTIDHKKIGIMYGVTSMLFFFTGGVEALLIRTQLARANQDLITGDTYNQIFTMHGLTMVFLVVMPLSAAFANYLIPLMIGARDVAFPRMNALSYWIFLLAGLFLFSSFFLGGAPNCGWFCYAPLNEAAFTTGNNVDFYAVGLQIAGIASLMGAINLIVTVVNMRAPGMSLLKMPVFVWMQFVTQFLLLFALPVITVALFLLTFNRMFDANFFNAEAGADPLLWQHLFWIFGHPEVYIMILPAFGIVSEILPVFTRKPLFGYPFMVFSGIAIGFMGWGVWAHHMFVSGIGPVSVAAFSLSTMFIAVPTGVKIFNWVGTLWKGNLRLDTPLLFAIGLVAMFTIGGLSGVTHSISPADTQQTDTYYIVAHFHYVLFGGALFGLVGGFYYWWPKIFGHVLNERLGKVHFWLMFVGFNLTFGPMHILGLQGMSRRYYTYSEADKFEDWNLVSTVGSYIILAAFLVFAVNILKSRKNPPAGNDPWDARTLEWTTSSPPPAHNFDVDPTVTQLDDFWHRKYQPDESGRLARVADVDGTADGQSHDDGEHADGDGHGGHLEGIHMPSPSYWPLVLTLGLPIAGYGLIFEAYVLCAIGAIVVLTGVYGWALEPSVAPEPHDEGDDSHEATPVPAGSAPAAVGAGAGAGDDAGDAGAVSEGSDS